MRSILLIDDDPIVRTLLAKVFSDAGWRVAEADDGDKGISTAFAVQPDVVLCDLLMPRCNGFQVCRALREKRSLLPKTFIIVCTSRDYATDRLNAFEAGADEYILKPIRPKELLEMLDPVEDFTAHFIKPEDPPTAAPAGTRQRNRICFWGVRGSIPTPGPGTVFYGGNTTCVELRADDEIIILDSGSGIRPLGVQLVNEFKDRPMQLSLLLTHTHWDHIQGFPFFAPSYNQHNRLHIYGFEGSRQGLEAALAGQMARSYFPIGLWEMPGHIVFEELKSMQFKIGRVEVSAMFVNHPGICVGYRLNTSQGSLGFIPDHEAFQRMRLHSKTNTVSTPDSIEFAKVEDDKLIRFIQGVDVLVLDSQYDEFEYQSHVGWGHSCMEDSVALALAAGVKRLFLFHHDPGHDDTRVSRQVARAREIVAAHGSDLIVDAAREGLLCELKPVGGILPARPHGAA